MKVQNADISWLESGLPYSTEFQDIYYSEADALAESEHVFLSANSLRERWLNSDRDYSFRLGELGFGAGLNFLQTCKLWLSSKRRPQHLHYIAFEKYPLRHEYMQQVHACWPALAELSASLLSRYSDHGGGCHRIKLDASITLDLYFGDAKEQLWRRMTQACPAIHCWYLDGFSPARNAELWQASLMGLVAASSEIGTTLSSYSVAGKVRNAILDAGFEVQKIEGFAEKRHSLFATKTEPTPTPANTMRRTPWFILPKPRFAGRTAAVVGAGLAGCSTAYSLAQRGWQVTVFDAGDGPAAGASGMARMALRCRLFNTTSEEAEYYLQAYLFALRQFADFDEVDWDPCSVLQLLGAMNKKTPLREENLREIYSRQVVELLDATAASQRAGLALPDAAWHFPQAGAIRPASLCRRYLAHPNISSLFNTPITSLVQREGRWHLLATNDEAAIADAVVIANSHGATTFSQCATLPLKHSRGQSTAVISSEASEQLRCVVSGGRSVFPSSAGRHIISASYAQGDDLQVSSADQRENIRLAREVFTDEASLSDEPAADRVALRCNSADRIPIVGMAPDRERMRERFGALALNAKAEFEKTGEYHSGLYLNVAHGSNGLASCPLSAEYLASLICGENLPLSRDMAMRLSPARFLISELKKQRS